MWYTYILFLLFLSKESNGKVFESLRRPESAQIDFIILECWYAKAQAQFSKITYNN